MAERAQKAAACQAKKAELDAEKVRAQAEQVARGCGRGGCGHGSGSGRGHGSGRGRGSGRAVAAVEAKGVVDMMVLERWLRTLATVILKKKFQYLI